MSAVAAPAPSAARQTSPYHVSFAHEVSSEWIKLRTVRSTWWTAGATVVLMVLISMGVAAGANSMAGSTGGSVIDGGQILCYGFIFAQLSVAVLGALAITGEYGTGMIRSTLSAAPTRLPAMWAKVLVTAIAAAVISLVGIAASYLVTFPMLHGNDLVPSLTDSAVLRAIGMCVLYLVLIAIMSVSIGFLIRHSAGAISVLVGILFVLWVVMNIVTSLLPNQKWLTDMGNFLPLNLGMMMISNSDLGSGLSQGTIIASTAAWAIIPLIAAAILLKKRDA